MLEEQTTKLDDTFDVIYFLKKLKEMKEIDLPVVSELPDPS